MIRVIGYSTLGYKPHGDDGIFYFRTADQFDAETAPSEDEMRSYCAKHGYIVPKGPIKIVMGNGGATRCESVYIFPEP